MIMRMMMMKRIMKRKEKEVWLMKMMLTKGRYTRKECYQKKM